MSGQATFESWNMIKRFVILQGQQMVVTELTKAGRTIPNQDDPRCRWGWGCRCGVHQSLIAVGGGEIDTQRRRAARGRVAV